MKKIIIFALVCAALVSCSRESLKENPQGYFDEGQIVRLSVNAPQTKVTSAVNGSTNGIDFVWEDGDKIKVSIGTKSSVFTLIEGEGTASAVFQGPMPDAGTTFNVQYPVIDQDIKSQTYSSTEPLQHDLMKFTSTNCTVGAAFSLTPAYSALKLNLYGNDETVGKIVITDVTANPNVSYTLNLPEAGVQVGTTSAAATPFYAVLPAGSRKFKVDVYDDASTKAVICSYSTSAPQTFTAGNVLIMPAKEVKALDVAFSVSATKKVSFSPANLYWDGSNWHFETSQLTVTTTRPANHISHFFYAADFATAYGTSTYYPQLGTACCFGESQGGLTVDGDSGYYLLTADEWKYLVGIDGGRSQSLRQCNVTVAGIAKCLVLAPDGYGGTIQSSYTADQWSAAEAEGLVCFTPCGNFNGSGFIDTTAGHYLTATLLAATSVARFYFNSFISVINPESGSIKALTVRLVKNYVPSKKTGAGTLGSMTNTDETW